MRNNTGLSEKEALISREKYGSNVISKKKKNKFVSLFIQSLGDPITKILLIALAIKILFIINKYDWYETIGIAIAVFLASFISTISEYGSEESFRVLQESASKIKCKIYRDGILKNKYVDEVVVGDIILLQSGDRIPADGTLVSGSISVDESSINGESKETHKTLTNNKLYKGTVVSSMEGKMLVTEVGDKTLFGNIAMELQEDKRDSPLKIRLTKLAEIISRFGYIGAFLVSLSYLFNFIVIQGNYEIFDNTRKLVGCLLHAITLAVTVIVVSVPEGLPMMITLVLSSNMKKMLKDNVLVRRMVGIETSGNINVLFTDKTGTITTGKLKVDSFINGLGNNYDLSDLALKKKLFDLVKLSLYYNNESYMDEFNKYAIGSNSTDRSLLEYINSYSKINNIKKKAIIPFNSYNKLSVVNVSGEYNLNLIKGAPEKIIQYCKNYYDDSGNKKLILNKNILNNKIKSLSEDGMRIIAIATYKDNKEELDLIGFIGIKDEIRKEVISAIKEVEKASIQIIMITGDSKDTAYAVAKDIGLINNENIVITSDELNNMSDEKIKEIFPKIRVIARALPTDKSRLVRIAQDNNLIVGMTGDGVNDAAALKKADVGISLGSGTEIAKEASDIVILDDNFMSISKAVLYGRTIFKNIRKFIIFQLTVNLCAVGLSIIGPFIGINTPITVIQMLWINMVMDTLAALAFAGEGALKEYMYEKPKRIDEHIINSYMFNQIFVIGIYSLTISILFLKLDIFNNYFTDNIHLMTAFFALFIFIGIFNSFNARTHRLNLLANIFKNKGFVIVMLFVTIIQLIIIYYGGFLFRTIGLNINEMLLIMILSFSVVPIDFIRKLYLKSKGNKDGV